MQLDHTWIASRIPHQGAMCLLDGVLAWDAQSVQCSATSHLDPGNPLRLADSLNAICGVEYAAQAVAVHGVLLAGAENAEDSAGAVALRSSGGYLTSLRNVCLHAERLDDRSQPLLIVAERFGGDGHMLLYDFAVRVPDCLLLEGRLSIVTQA